MEILWRGRAKALQILDGEIEGVMRNPTYYKMSERKSWAEWAKYLSLSNTSCSGQKYQCKMAFCFDAQTAMDAWRWQGLKRLETTTVPSRPYTIFNDMVFIPISAYAKTRAGGITLCWDYWRWANPADSYVLTKWPCEEWLKNRDYHPWKWMDFGRDWPSSRECYEQFWIRARKTSNEFFHTPA